MTAEPRESKLAEHLQVLRAQVGDPEAFAALFDRYHARLLYFLRRLVNSPAEAEDALQEVWIRVVRKIAGLEEPAAFRAWVYRIAHNQAVSRLRRSARAVPLDELEEEPAAPPESGAFDAFDTVQAEALQRGLEQLSVPHREVLVLRFLEELSYDEIAQVTGCTVGTVRSRLHYAKKHLFHHLKSTP